MICLGAYIERKYLRHLLLPHCGSIHVITHCETRSAYQQLGVKEEDEEEGMGGLLKKKKKKFNSSSSQTIQWPTFSFAVVGGRHGTRHNGSTSWQAGYGLTSNHAKFIEMRNKSAAPWPTNNNRWLVSRCWYSRAKLNHPNYQPEWWWPVR